MPDLSEEPVYSVVLTSRHQQARHKWPGFMKFDPN